MGRKGSSPEFVRTTCPRDCYDACGLLVARTSGGIRKVLGDPEHHVSRGSLCGKCAIAYNGVWLDPGARLTRPLRRTGAKGSGIFEPITWTAALAEIADRFLSLADRGRSEAILHAHYTGTVGLLAGWFPLRFFNHLGATEVDPDTVCNKAGHVALDYVFGTSLEGFDPETAKDARTILVWGANPSHSAPHMHRHWLRECGARILVVDPLSHATAREVASLHLKLRPGSDAALAFGLLHVAARDGLLDRAFIAENVVGFERLESAIAAADPATTEARTGVPRHLIEQAALEYARGPSLLWLGQGMQRTTRGGNAFRAIAALVAGTGNLGRPGTGFCYMNGPGTRGIDISLLTAPEIGRGGASISHMDLAACLEDQARTASFFTWNCNPLASSPEQGRLRKALRREDLFTVACDVFPTDTVAYADIVLPAASFLEFDDLVAPYFHHTLSAQVKVVDPPGEALPNMEIFRRLAAAMGFTAPALFETDSTLIERILASTPYRGTFADLAQQGTVRLFSEPRQQFRGLRFPTPSGRIEIASARAEADGLPAVPEPHADPPPAHGRLRVLSPASAWLMNSSYGNEPNIEKKLGPAAIVMHPEDASRFGVSDGASVTLANEAGSLRLAVVISDVAQPGVGVVYKGRWPSRTTDGANVNVLNGGYKSDMGASTTVHSVEATLLVDAIGR